MAAVITSVGNKGQVNDGLQLPLLIYFLQLMSMSQVTSSTKPDLSSVTLAVNGEYFASSGSDGVHVWRVEDGKLKATMAAEQVECVAFSKDSKWIAAGTYWGDVMVWDAKVYKQPFTTWKTNGVIRGVDFSPDSTRLLALGDRTVIVRNITTRERVVGPLNHDDRVWAAKYSPEGDRIATATQKCVQVFDSNDGRLLVTTRLQVATCRCNTNLVWSNNHVFVISEGQIKQIDASTGARVSEWSVPNLSASPCIAVPQQEGFIACTSGQSVTFWDTSTRTKIGLFRHQYSAQDVHSIALSPDGRFLAIGIGGENQTITIKRLSRITESDIQIDESALDLWKDGHHEEAEALLTEDVLSRNPHHHVLAGRALIRARLRHWGAAIEDADKSIEIQPSIGGYIAKSVALVGKGERHKAYRACDIAFEHCHPTRISFLLLVKAVIVCMAGEHQDAILRVNDLIDTLHLNSVCYVVQAYMHLLHGKSLMRNGNYQDAVQSFKDARKKLRHHTSQTLEAVSLISGWKFDDLDITLQQCLCKALYAAGRTNEAGESLLLMINTIDGEVYMRRSSWVSDFLQKYLSIRESSDNVTLESTRDERGSTLYAPTLLLKEWVKLKLTKGSWADALTAANRFIASRFTVYRIVCEQLDMLNKIMDATKCFHEMMEELKGRRNRHADQADWVLGFKQNLSQKLEYLGDGARHAGRHDEAISVYSAALSLDPTSPQGFFIKRSKAYVAAGLWESGLQDANEVINLDPSSPWGYERMHAALHWAGRYDDAIATFETMLSKISQSPDQSIRERRREYVNPARTKAAIRRTVQNVIRDSPRILIHTSSGRLLDKAKQATLFESLPVYKELISSTTTDIDYTHIHQEVSNYYRYATFSHTWEDNEPTFEEVIHMVVYELDESFTHNKLQMFCKIARDTGLHWAWSDTCCINKADHFVLQEALVAMFKWYEGSAVTIVFLRGVHSPSRHGDLMRSIWNTRAWTFQEYHASKVVRFYTEDWKPYLNIDVPNHKESPEIISEMEEATGVKAQSLMALRPGLHDIREKLCLASGRETTFVEDAAYSLLGIFSASLPIVYGEGDQALGRLLAQLITNSGDTTILAWTGKSGSFNSCLPSSIGVFGALPTSHIPPSIADAEVEAISPRIRPTSPNFMLVMKLYDRLHELLVPSFANQRMKLPCLTFRLGPVSGTRNGSGHVFRARTGALGVVEIKTTEDLSQLDSLTLIHPWIDYLLDRQSVGGIPETNHEQLHHKSSVSEPSPHSGPSSPSRANGQTTTSRIISLIGRPFSAADTSSLQSPSPVSLSERRLEVLRFIARLRQPFAALLFTRNRQNVEEYKRVAAGSLITVRVGELTPTVLNKVIEGVGMLDVL